MADYSTMTDAELLSAAGTPNYGAMSDAELVALSKPPVPPEPTSLPEERSFVGDVATAGRRGFWTAQDMIGGAQKAFSSVGGGMYEQGQAVQDLAASKLAKTENTTGRDRGFVANTVIKGVEAVSQMAPVLALSAVPVVGQVLGPAAAVAMYGGSTYQDTKERMLKQEGIDDTFAAANPDDPRVQKANRTSIATGAVQGTMDAASTAIGGKFITAAMPNLGKATASGLMKTLANPGSSTAVKFLKGWAVAGLTEAVTEPVQDETQAYIERQAGLKDAPAFMAQAADSAQGGLGAALLLGPIAGLSHANAYRKAKAIQVALTDPTVDPMIREMAAGIVADDLQQADPVAASNFRTHAADAIGGKTLTGSDPYGLDLTSDALITMPKAPTVEVESSPILDVLTDLADPNTDSTTVAEAFAAVVNSAGEGLAQPELSTPLSTPVENIETLTPPDQLQVPEGVDPLTGEVTNEPMLLDPLDAYKGYPSKEAAYKKIVKSGQMATHETVERSDGLTVIVPKTEALTAAVKEPWEMTKTEWVKEQGKRVSGQSVEKSEALAKNLHRQFVKSWLEEGKPVSPEVLQDYPELVAPKTVTLGGITAAITPEQQTAWDAIDADHQSSVAMYQRQAEISKDPAMMAKKIKGSAMRAAAAKREAAPQFRTAKEVAAAMAREASNYVGKEVSHNGEAAVVVGGGFGKVKIRTADGVEKSVPKGEINDIQGVTATAPTESATLVAPSTVVPAETQEVPTSQPQPVAPTFSLEETQHFLNGIPSQYRDAKGQAELLGIVDTNIKKLKDDLDFEDVGSPEAESIQKSLDGLAQSKAMLEHLSEQKGAADVSTDRRVGTEDTVRGRGAIAGDVEENKGISTAGDKKASPDNVAGRAAVSKIKFAGASDEVFFTPARAVGDVGKAASQQKPLTESQLRSALSNLVGRKLTAGQFKFTGADSVQSILHQIASAFGYKIQPYQASMFGDGFVSPQSPGVIYVNKDGKSSAVFLMGHELTHTLRTSYPELYNELWDYVSTAITPAKLELRRNQMRKDAKLYEGLSDADLNEEIMADLVGNEFQKPGFWDKMAEAEPTLFAKVINLVRVFVNFINQKLKGNTAAIVADLKRLDTVTATVFAKYARLQQEGKFTGDVAGGGVKFLSAWHGSPHDHDKFSNEKIGTGEGAQAYGYGLYFAGNRDVADWYREKLARDAAGNDEQLRLWGNELFDTLMDNDMLGFDTLREAKAAIKENSDWTDRWEVSPADAVKINKLMADYDSRLKQLKKGKLYQVELAPKEDEYLLWDKPLSEQSEKVKAALSDAMGVGILGKESGQILYHHLSGNMSLGSDKAASEYLHSLGIRGIKYADGNTRNKEEQNFNYVIFNDEDVSITMKFLASEEAGATTDELGRVVGERVYDGIKVGTVKSIPSDDAKGRATAHIANVKTELEGLGYEVSGVAFAGTGSYQFVVSRDGLPLLQVARTIHEPFFDGDGYTAKLDFAAGLQQTMVSGEPQATSLGAYNDVMWSELDSLSQLVDSVEVVLLGHGSAAWWTKNIDPKAEQGNTAVINFVPDMKKDLPIRNTAAHAKISKEGVKNEWQPTYAPMDTGAIREEAYVGTAVSLVYRSGLPDEQKSIQGGVTLKRSGSAQVRTPGVHKGGGDKRTAGLDGGTSTTQGALASEAGATTAGQKEKAAKLWVEKGVESPFFKKWFGDSKVVDAQGKPLVVYHGSSSKIDSFDPAKARRGMGLIFFSPDKNFSGGYGDTTPVFLQASNLFDASADPAAFREWVSASKGSAKVQSTLREIIRGLEDSLEQDELGYYGIEPVGDALVTADDVIVRVEAGLGTGDWYIAEADGFPAYLKAQGFDGVRMNEQGAVTYGVFSPNQIKSATDNSGEFDGANPSIKFAAGEPKAVNDWFKKSGLKNSLNDMLTTSLRYIMPTDRTVGMALTQAIYKPIYRQLKQYLDLRGKKAGHVQAIMTEAHIAAQMLKKHFNAAEMKSFSDLVFKATEMQLHADGAATSWTPESWEKAGMQEKFGTLKEAQAKLTAQYNKLNPDQKKAHSAMLQQLEKVYLEGREAALAPFKASFPDIYAKAVAYNKAVDDSYDVKTPVTAPDEAVKSLADTIKHIDSQYPMLQGDYMPLMRFGKYLVRTVEQDENGETGKRTRTEFFDSQSEAIAYAERINSSPTNLLHAEVELSKSLGDRGVVNIPAIMIDKLKTAAESRGMSGEALEQLIRDAEALRINMMPRTSTSGNKLQREGVEGYNTNVMKVFASYISNHANANAGILYGTQIEQAFRDMGNAIKAYRSEPGYDIKGAIEQDTLYKHLYENEKSSSKVKINDLTKNLGKASFLWYLSSPSIWAVQWSQPFMVTVPKMAARYGYGKALKAYSAAAKRYLHGDFSDEKIFNFNREHEFVGDRIYDLIAKSSEDGADIKALNRQINNIFDEYKDAKEQRLIILKVLSLQGRIDLSMSHNFQELAASTNSGDAAYDKLTKLGSKGMEKASFFMQHSETGSRRAAAVASFELALGKDNFIEANAYASDIINDTLFDFDSGNRGKAWQGNTGHILGQFQFFRLHMLGKMLQLGKDAIGGEYKRALAEATTQEEKDVALAKRNESRSELAYMTGTSMALAGAAGTPLALAFGNTLTTAIMNAIGMLFGDDDDPWDVAKDLENAVRAALGDTAGNVVLKGLPSLIGMDISKRIGLGGIGNIVMGDPPAGAGTTAKANWYAGRLLGPAWGMVSDTMRAGDAFAKGDIVQAAQYSSPKVLRDFIKMAEMADHGVQGGGKTLLKPEDVSPYSYALMMVGINPLEVSLASEESRYLKNLSTSLSQRRSSLIKDLAVATADSDSDAKDSAIEGINSWSEKNPKLRITAQELLSGIKRERNKRSGKLTPKEQLVKAEYAQ